MKKNLDWEEWEEEKPRLGKMRRGKTSIGIKWEEEKPKLEKMRRRKTYIGENEGTNKSEQTLSSFLCKNCFRIQFDCYF